MTPQSSAVNDDAVAADAMAARRASARRTALIVAGIAFAVYVGFIVTASQVWVAGNEFLAKVEPLKRQIAPISV